MRKLLSAVVSVALLLLPLAGSAPVRAQQNPPSNQSYVAGRFVARNYNYTGIRIFSGNTSGAGAATFALSSGSIRLPDGRTIVPFSAGGINTAGNAQVMPAIPITIGSGTTKETVTPTAVTGCYIGAPQGTCQITATFANAHGQGEVVTSGSLGIQEAINDAATFGGGIVDVDKSEDFYGGGSGVVNSALIAALVMPNVVVEDTRSYATQYWTPQGGSTVVGTPATLTAVTALPSTTPVGTFTATNYNMCIAYVDIMGQEGTCSTSFVNTGAGATSSFIFSAPAASTGAVGYTIYIGLTGAGSTTLQYKVPLVTQPTVQGTYPVSNGVCTLTQIETVTPACAVANTSYGQTGSTATVTAITVNTSPIQPITTTISTTSVYIPNPGGRTAYNYAPGSHMGTPGVPVSNLVYPIGAAAGSTVPTVEGTINIAPGFMNVVGRTLEVCGFMTTTASAATIENVQLQWDAMGQNTAGKGVPLVDMTATTTLATTGHISFCADLQTTVASASATGGSINAIGGFETVSGVTIAGTNAAGTNTVTGATGSLNLADDARINVIYLHTTGTDGAGWTLQSLTAKVIN